MKKFKLFLLTILAFSFFSPFANAMNRQTQEKKVITPIREFVSQGEIKKLPLIQKRHKFEKDKQELEKEKQEFEKYKQEFVKRKQAFVKRKQALTQKRLEREREEAHKENINTKTINGQQIYKVIYEIYKEEYVIEDTCKDYESQIPKYYEYIDKEIPNFNLQKLLAGGMDYLDSPNKYIPLFIDKFITYNLMSEEAFEKIKQNYTEEKTNLRWILTTNYIKEMISKNDKLKNKYVVPDYKIVTNKGSLKDVNVFIYFRNSVPFFEEICNVKIYSKNIKGQDIIDNKEINRIKGELPSVHQLNLTKLTSSNKICITNARCSDNITNRNNFTKYSLRRFKLLNNIPEKANAISIYLDTEKIEYGTLFASKLTPLN